MRMQGMACKWDFFSLFPAYAGVILYMKYKGKEVASFPRVCGGDPELSCGQLVEKYFSPRMRG